LEEADSKGEEGKFFVWKLDEIREVLSDQADELMAACGVTRHGNFEGTDILEFAGDLGQRPALAEAPWQAVRSVGEACAPQPRREGSDVAERADPG
jgi:uncharacterized protein YyaL (SSP411 family)